MINLPPRCEDKYTLLFSYVPLYLLKHYNKIAYVILELYAKNQVSAIILHMSHPIMLDYVGFYEKKGTPINYRLL